jgi:hypothetical protein
MAYGRNKGALRQGTAAGVLRDGSEGMSKSCPVTGRYVHLQVAEGIMRFMMERIP